MVRLQLFAADKNADSFSRVVSWWVLAAASTVLCIGLLQRSVQHSKVPIVSSL